MGFLKENLRRYAEGGSIADATYGAVTVGMYHYLTNDLISAIETDGYFDAAAPFFTEGGGDHLLVCADRDGTPETKAYYVKRVGGDVALTPEVDDDGS
jgi:hypothetical protein